jgi:hypothetical protein
LAYPIDFLIVRNYFAENCSPSFWVATTRAMRLSLIQRRPCAVSGCVLYKVDQHAGKGVVAMTVVSATGAPSAAISTPTAGTPTSEAKRHAHLSDSENRGVNGMVTSTSQGAKHGSKTAKEFQTEVDRVDEERKNGSISPEAANAKLMEIRGRIGDEITHELQDNCCGKHNKSIAGLNKAIEGIDVQIRANDHVINSHAADPATAGTNSADAAGIKTEQKTVSSLNDSIDQGKKLVKSGQVSSQEDLTTMGQYASQTITEYQGRLDRGDVPAALIPEYKGLIKNATGLLDMGNAKLDTPVHPDKPMSAEDRAKLIADRKTLLNGSIHILDKQTALIDTGKVSKEAATPSLPQLRSNAKSYQADLDDPQTPDELRPLIREALAKTNTLIEKIQQMPDTKY